MRKRIAGSLVALAVAAPLIAIAAPGAPSAIAVGPNCDLANGVEHVVEITFDNVHFFRDNPNVPSDLELMPHLRAFIEDNGVLLSNNHTPLIAHTAEDSLAIYTGLYGDRHGMPISNSYRTYNPDGTTNAAGSFVYWTDPNNDGGHNTKHAMIHSDRVPAAGTTMDVATPGPWVPWTRAGCDVGDVSTANMVLENASFDIPKVFGAQSPETAQLNDDPNSFKNAEVADYVGLAVHCAKDSEFCSSAQAVKYGDTTPSSTAVVDALPDEPGGYSGYQALFRHRYIAPQLGAGTPSLSHNGYQVTNADGNLIDLSGNEIDGAFLTNYPGFPGFGPIVARQTLGTRPTCSRPGCRSPTATSATSTSGRRDSPGARRRRPLPPGGRSVPGTAATCRPPRSTTRPSRPSSPGWRPPASRRTTPCSSSAPRRTTSSTARMSGARSSPRPPAATA